MAARFTHSSTYLTKPRYKPSVVVLVHEVYGLSNWARGMADDLAGKGFVVVAPDFLSGHGPHGGGFSDFPREGERVNAVKDLDPEGKLADLDAAVDYGKKLPDTSGNMAVVGFSWGGWKSFAFATPQRPERSVRVLWYRPGGRHDHYGVRLRILRRKGRCSEWHRARDSRRNESGRQVL